MIGPQDRKVDRSTLAYVLRSHMESQIDLCYMLPTKRRERARLVRERYRIGATVMSKYLVFERPQGVSLL